jgi:hypothetical protein
VNAAGIVRKQRLGCVPPETVLVRMAVVRDSTEVAAVWTTKQFDYTELSSQIWKV